MSNSKKYWIRWYAAVTGFLLLQVVLYYLFTKHWS